MERRLQATIYLCFYFLVWDATICFVSSALTENSGNKDTFTIQHVGTGKCLVAGASGVSLGVCDASRASQWKWGSGHRLFHVGTAQCLGLAVRSKALSLYSCGSTGETMLWWRCLEGALYTVYQMGLTVSDERVSAKRDSADAWRRDHSPDNICQQPYHIVHTLDGDSAGAPCEFPFLYNGTWHHDCLPDDDNTSRLSWCATTSNYDTDRKRGHCLTPEEGCKALFNGTEEGPCYQFVSRAAVTWQEALDSCRSQGADLLSLSSPEDRSLSLLAGGHDDKTDKMWIGLHQLDTAQGWQWSDGSPLSYLSWEKGMPSVSILRESDCGVLNYNNNYETESCDKLLPYICKKNINVTQSGPTEPLVYKATACEEGWSPWNTMCYKLIKDEPTTFALAEKYCEASGGGLVSLHSLDSLDMISTQFHADGALDVWIGLIATDGLAVFKWADQSPVSFTYWGKSQPLQPSGESACVFYSGESHGWSVGQCEKKLPFMCQKKGQVNESATEAGCPPGGEWRRHGNSCYKVDSKEVSFKDRCDLTIRNRFEQAFINRLLGEQINMKSQYYWTGLQDIKSTGEYQWVTQDGAGDRVTYTNWGWFQPALAGGCAVMSTVKPLGTWEVKNCTLFKAGSICKRDIGTPQPIEPEPNPNGTCPDGWRSKPGISYCYKVFHEERLSRKRSWEEAERFCEALGAHLPSFTQLEEMRALHYVMRDSISDDRFFWVGLNRRNPAEHVWEWSDGRPVSMGVLRQEFHENDEYNRECTAFKTMKGTFRSLFVFLHQNFPPNPFHATPFHCDAKLEWVCQIPRGKTPKTPEWYNPDGHHETSIFVDGSEYWFLAEPKLTYEEASLYCNSNGSKLAAPRSFTAARQIHQALSGTSQAKESWWADMREPGNFFPMTFTQMRYYHTAFLGRCTSISPDSIFPEYENSCERRLPFVCEKHNATSVETHPLEPHPVGLACSSNALHFRDKCYTVIKPLYFNFKQANEYCQSLKGTLLTISDQVEQDFVTSLMPELPEKSWIGLKLKVTDPEWVDDSPVDFLNFNSLLHGLLRPMVINTRDPESMELCVFMFKGTSSAMMGTWDYTTCSDQQFLSICQHYADKLEEPQVPTEAFKAQNHTFKLVQQNMTWFEALEVCRNQDMDLASVADTFQQSVLTVHVSRARSPMWIGLFSEDEGVHYRWTDHSHTVYSRWSSEPTSGRCVYLDTDGFWKATECEEVLAGAICHVPHEETITTPDNIAVKCPHKSGGPNWIPFKNNCYTFQLTSSRWDDFNKGHIHETCKKLDDGADILTIRNTLENDFVRQHLLPFKDLVQFVWLGVFHDDTVNQLNWYDGTNVQYSNWKHGRPDINEEFMAGLNEDGVWEIFTNKRHFNLLKQRSIVACKIEKDSKDEYKESARDFELYGNLSYHVVTKRLSWFQALEECGQRGGHLASVHDTAHNAHVELIANRDGFPLWIGLSSQDASGSTYEWSDGTKYDHKPVISGAPGKSSSDPQGICVYVTTSGAWMRTDCQAMVDGALCYNTTITTPNQRASPQSSQMANHCPQNSGTSKWVQYKDHCYAFDMTFYNYSVYSMEEAKGICENLDAQLLTIKTQAENDFVSGYMAENPLITSRVWLGMDLDTHGKAVGWVDGSAPTFTNWEAVTAATTVKSQPPCAVMMSADEGRWSRVSCKDSHSRIVCKVPTRSGGSPVALVFFFIVLFSLLGVIVYVIYKKNRARFSSTVRYKRNFDAADSTSIITETE